MQFQDDVHYVETDRVRLTVKRPRRGDRMVVRWGGQDMDENSLQGNILRACRAVWSKLRPGAQTSITVRMDEGDEYFDD